MLLLSKVSLSFAATTSYPAPMPVTGESSSTVGSASGAAWPQKRFVSGRGTTESCVTDKLTGLIWSKNGNLFGAMVWESASSVVKNMNGTDTKATAYKLCGYSDWRLPTKNELKSLVNYGDKISPSNWLNYQGFYNVRANTYWSSTSYATNTDVAWHVNFAHGYVGADNKDYTGYVWPVRRAK